MAHMGPKTQAQLDAGVGQVTPPFDRRSCEITAKGKRRVRIAVASAIMLPQPNFSL